MQEESSKTLLRLQKRMQKGFVGFWSSGVYVCSWGEPITNTYEEKASLMLILPHLISNIFACYEGKCWMCVPVVEYCK